MMLEKCAKCGKAGADIEYSDTGRFVCDSCAEGMFVCPDCGKAFDSDDAYHIAGAFCSDCERNH